MEDDVLSGSCAITWARNDTSLIVVKYRRTRESPSGKASAFQADIRGFESRLPLSFSDQEAVAGYRH